MFPSILHDAPGTPLPSVGAHSQHPALPWSQVCACEAGGLGGGVPARGEGPAPPAAWGAHWGMKGGSWPNPESHRCSLSSLQTQQQASKAKGMWMGWALLVTGWGGRPHRQPRLVGSPERTEFCLRCYGDTGETARTARDGPVLQGPGTVRRAPRTPPLPPQPSGQEGLADGPGPGDGGLGSEMLPRQ